MDTSVSEEHTAQLRTFDLQGEGNVLLRNVCYKPKDHNRNTHWHENFNFRSPTLVIPTSTASKGWRTQDIQTRGLDGFILLLQTNAYDAIWISACGCTQADRWESVAVLQEVLLLLPLLQIVDRAQKLETFTNAHIWLWIDTLHIQIYAICNL